MESYLDTFKDAVGEQGLIVMPTFSYSACEGEVFDVNNTKSKSKIGVLPEYFRKQKDVKRSLHPIFSFAAWGDKAEDFLKFESFNCFGEKHIFGKLYNINATYVLFGIDMQHGATYVFYSEQKINVYYRYYKNFPAIIRDNNKEFKTTVKYFVRNLNLNPKDYFYELEKRSLETGITNSFKFGSGNILIMKSQEIDGLIREEVKKNKDYLIRKGYE